METALDYRDQLAQLEQQSEARCTLRKKVRLDKSNAQKNHAVKRAMQRYGLYLTFADLNAITLLIQQGKTIIAEKQSLRVSLHTLTYKDKKVRVVYDRVRKNIVSFLPLEPKKKNDIEEIESALNSAVEY